MNNISKVRATGPDETKRTESGYNPSTSTKRRVAVVHHDPFVVSCVVRRRRE